MKASDCEVIDTYTVRIGGQTVEVKRYEPTVADANERNHANLSFHKGKRSRLTHRAHSVRRYLNEK